MEKETVAKHEVGHAMVATAVARLVPSLPDVEKLSIIPRSGGALGFTYTPPKSEDRALMFDSEIRGQLAMLMGGRAAEHLTCAAVSTGAMDDIRRATDLAYKSVSEFGLNPAVGPLNVGVLAAGGGDEGAFLMKDSGGGWRPNGGGGGGWMDVKERRQGLRWCLTMRLLPARILVSLPLQAARDSLSTLPNTHTHTHTYAQSRRMSCVIPFWL